MNTRRYYSNNEVVAEVAIQMAHDIRSPLTALLAVMSHPGHFDDSKRQLALKATKRVQEIAEEMMNHYRTVKQVKEEDALEVSVAGIIENMIEEKRLTLPSSIRINTSFNGTVLKNINTVRAKEFKRILSNIMNNSVEAIYKKSPHGEIKISIMGNVETLEILIEDDGCGIPKDILAKIGKKGYTWKKKNGHGLGLYRAKKVMENWNGEFAVESELGEWTRVRMRF